MHEEEVEIDYTGTDSEKAHLVIEHRMLRTQARHASGPLLEDLRGQLSVLRTKILAE